METQYYSRPSYRNDFAIWMGQHAFTHAVTLSCPYDQRYGTPGLPASEYQGQQFKEVVDVLLYRLRERVFGRGRNLQELYHATYFECWDRSGWPTFWHAHCLFQIPEAFSTRFDEQVERQWMRALGPSGRHDCIEIKRIDNLAGATRYATKFAENGTLNMFDFCLPPVKFPARTNP